MASEHVTQPQLFGSQILFSVILADVRPQCDSVLDLFVAEWTVEGEAVNMIGLYVLPEAEILLF